MISIIDDQHDKSDVKRCRTAERNDPHYWRNILTRYASELGFQIRHQVLSAWMEF